MKNVLNYYYNIDINHITYSDGEYRFNFQTSTYIFSNVNRSDEELLEIYNICGELHKLQIPVHQIILNKDNNIVTIYDNKRYVLLRKQKKSNEIITLTDIAKFSNITIKKWDYKYVKRLRWDKLWVKKVDYFGYQIVQLGQKRPLISQLFSYYEGIIENSIQLLNMYNNINVKYSICHERIDVGMTFDEFYNPINFIIDYTIRDIAEYLKSRLFINIDIYEEVEYCLKFYKYTDYEKLLLFIRIFFPSRQLDALEKNILYGNDKIGYELVNLNFFYEENIKKIYALFNTYIGIYKIDWLI